MRIHHLRISLAVLGLMLAACSGGGGGGDMATGPDEGAYGSIASDIFTGYQAPAGAELVERTWPDGSLRSRGYEIDPGGAAVRVGPYLSWHDNEAQESEGSFQDGMRDGYWHFWYDNGQEQGEGWYQDDELDRSRFWTAYQSDGSWSGGHDAPGTAGSDPAL